VLDDVHERHAWHFADPAAEVAIALECKRSGTLPAMVNGSRGTRQLMWELASYPPGYSQ